MGAWRSKGRLKKMRLLQNVLESPNETGYFVSGLQCPRPFWPFISDAWNRVSERSAHSRPTSNKPLTTLINDYRSDPALRGTDLA